MNSEQFHHIVTQPEDWPDTPSWTGASLCLCLIGPVTLYTDRSVELQIRSRQAIQLSHPPARVHTHEGLVIIWEGTLSPHSQNKLRPVSPQNLEIIHRLLGSEDLREERIQATLHYLSFELDAEAMEESSRNPEKELHNFLSENLDQNLGLEELAKNFGTSRSSFLRLCRAQLGSPPVTYLSELRIQKAKALLQDPLHTISQVGYQIGYDSPSTFSHFFKKATGRSPRDYRSNYEWLV